MQLLQLRLRNFRNYPELVLPVQPGLSGGASDVAPAEFPDALIALVGPNGFGKTNFVEAVGYLSGIGSFRGASTDAVVRSGETAAVIRGLIDDDGRQSWIEMEIQPSGRNRMLVNRQKAGRKDLAAAFRVSVFSPNDLELIRGGPAARRQALDDAVVALNPSNDSIRSNLERVLRQRNALLKSTKGSLDQSGALTLDVWDGQFSEYGERWTDLRVQTLTSLVPVIQREYERISGSTAAVDVRYESTWRAGGLTSALAASRRDDVRRGVTLTGPHRDDIHFELNHMASRDHASQGEQRSLAIAFRLAVHLALAEAYGSAPVLILDDVLSELDDFRRAALIEAIPNGQVFLTSASDIPSEVDAAMVLSLSDRGVIECR